MVALAAALAYANTLHNLPVLDDGWAIFDNPLIKHVDQVGAIFRGSYGAAAAVEHRGLYRPLTTLSYAINWQMGGLDVLGYHVVNIGLHVLCCLLVLDLATLLGEAAHPGTPRATAALLAALLFAVHPVHVEAVTALVGRSELLAAGGALGCIYLTCTRRRARWRYPVALVLLGAGILSKENAAVAPLLFALVAVTLPGAADLEARPGTGSAEARRALRQGGALVAGMAAVIAICVLLRPPDAKIPVAALWFHDLDGRIVFNTMTRVLAEYWQLLVVPVPLGLHFYYASRFPYTPTFTLACLVDTAVWLAILCAGGASLRRAPLRAVGILWVFIALLPVLNIVRGGVLMAERLLYLPSVGFCILAGTGVAALRAHLNAAWGRVLAVGIAAVGILLAVKTWTRNAEWQNGYALWRAEVAREPQSPIPNTYLAREYMTRGELDSAGAHVLIALNAAPDYWDANLSAGRLAYRLHQDSAAARLMERAHALAPEEPDPLFFLATMRAAEGRLAVAVTLLSEAEAIDPAQARTRICRGWYLKQLGQSGEADAELKRTLELDPAVSLGNCLATGP